MLYVDILQDSPFFHQFPGRLKLTRRGCPCGVIYAGGLYGRRHRFNGEVILRARLEIVDGVICGVFHGNCSLAARFLIALDNRIVGYAFRVHHGRLPSQLDNVDADGARAQKDHVLDFRN